MFLFILAFVKCSLFTLCVYLYSLNLAHFTLPIHKIICKEKRKLNRGQAYKYNKPSEKNRPPAKAREEQILQYMRMTIF